MYVVRATEVESGQRFTASGVWMYRATAELIARDIAHDTSEAITDVTVEAL